MATSMVYYSQLNDNIQPHVLAIFKHCLEEPEILLLLLS